MKNPDKTPKKNGTADPAFVEKFQQLFETSRDGIFFVDGGSGMITDANPAMEALLGYSRDVLVGKTLQEIENLMNLPELPKILRELERKKTVIRDDLSLQGGDGRVVHAELTCTVQKVGKEKVLQFSFHDIMKHRQVKDALEETKYELERFFNLSIELMCIANIEGYFLYLNPAWESTLGYSEKELLQQPFLNFIHPDDVESTRLAVRQLAAQQDVINFVNRYRCKDGTYRWLEWHSKPAGKLIFAAASDITERRNAEIALHASEEQFRLLAETSFDIISRHTPDGVYLYVSPACRKIMGYEPEELLGHSAFEFIHPDDHGMIESALTKILGEKENAITIFRIRRKDGVDVWAESISHVVIDKNTGKAAEIQVTTRDVTERKKAEEALRASETRYRALAEASHDMIFIIDHQGCVEYVNDFAAQQVKRNPGDIVGRPLLDMFSPQVSERQARNVQKIFETGKPLYVENEAGFPERRAWLGTWFSPIKNAVGEIVSVLGTSRDITERIQVENALRESEKHYRDLFENAVLGIFQSSPDGKIIAVNQAFARMFGYESPEEVRETIQDVATDIFADPNRRAEVLRLNAEDPSRDTFENLYRRKDGSTFHGMLHLRTVTDSANRPVYLEGFVEDITERKRTEEALRESEAKYSAVIETTVTGYVVLDEAGCVVDANPNYAGLTGHGSVDEIMGRMVTEWTAEYDLERNRQEIVKCLETGSIRYLEIDYCHPDGTIVPVEINASVIETRQGKRIVTLCRNITARRQAEKSLRESEWRNQIIARLTTDYIFVVEVSSDGNLRLVWASDSMQRMTGRTVAEAATTDLWNSIIHPEDRQGFLQFIQQILTTAKSGEFECRSFTLSGAGRWIRILAQPQVDEKNRVNTIVGAVKDISEGKQAEQAIRESEEKFSKAFHTSPDSININRLSDGKFIEINEGFTQLTGYTIEDVTGKSSVDINLWANLEDRARLIETLIERGEVSNMETQFRLKDGTIKTGLMSAKLITISNEKCILSITRDISERKQVEDALQKSEERMRAIVDAAPFGAHSYELHSDNHLIFSGYNQAANRILGIDHAALIGKTIEEAFPDLIDNPIPDTYRRVASAGLYFEDEQIQYDEGRIHGAFEIHAYQTGTNRMTVFFRDITERKKADEALRASEARLHTLLNGNPEAHFLVDTQGKILIANQVMAERLGKPLTEIIGARISAVMPGETAKNRRQYFQETLRTGQSVHFEDESNGRYYSIYMQPVLDETGCVAQIAIMEIDITEQKRAATELANMKSLMDTAIEQTPVSMALVSVPDNVVRYVNRACMEFLGYTNEPSPVGRALTDMDITWQDFNADGTPLSFEEMPLMRAMRGEATYQKEYSILTRQGQRRWELVTGVPIYNADGQQIAAFVVWTDITERKQVEEMANIANERLDLATRAAHLGIWDWDVKNDRLAWDERMFELYGIRKEDFSGNYHAWLDRVHPDDTARCDDEIKKALNGEKEYDIEFRVIWPDNTIHFIKANGQIVRDPDGHAIRMTGINSNITDSKLAEEELFNSKQMLLTVLDTIPQRVFWKDRNLVYVGCNKPLALDCGYEEPTQLIGKTDYETTSAATADLYRADDRQVMETGVPKINYEELQIKTDGSQGWLITSKVPLRDKEGQVIGVLGTYDDITERKRAEESLQQRESYLTAIIENQPGLVWLKDKESRFLAVNQAFAKSCGLERPELIIGKNDFDVWPSELAEKYKADDLNVMRKKTSITVEEQIYDSGVAKWFETFKTPVMNEKGEIIGTTGYAHDITDRKRADDALRESERLLQASQKVARLGSYILDVKNGFWKSSPILDDIFGIDSSFPHDIDGWIAIIHPDSQQEMAAYFSNEVILKKQRFDKEYKIIRQQDGSEHWVHGLGDLEIDQDGTVLRMVGTIQDITDRKQAEVVLAMQTDELRRRNAELARLYRASRTLLSISIQSVNELANTIVNIVTQDLGKSNCSLLLVRPHSNSLDRIAIAGPYADQVSKAEVLLDGHGLVPKAIHTGMLINVADVLNEPEYVPNWHAARSEMAVPLHVGDKVIGIIDIQSAEPNAFNVDDERVLDLFGEQAALALEHAILFEAEQRRVNRLASLQRLAAELAAIHNRRELLDTIVERAAALAESPTATLIFFDPEGESATIAAQTGLKILVPVSPRAPMTDPTFQQTILAGKPLIITDIDQQAPNLRNFLVHPDLKAFFAFPLEQKGKIIGAITLSSLVPRKISEGETTTYDLLAKLASAALDNVDLFEETNNSLQRLASLRAVDMVIASSFDTRLTLSVLLEQLIAQLHVDAAAILIYNPLLFTLKYECSQGFRTQSPISVETHIGEGLPGQVVRERRIIHVPDLQNQIGGSSLAMLIREEKFVTYFGTPIIAKGQIKGVLEIYSKQILSPDSEWFDFLDMLSGQAAIAIDNAELFTNLQRSNSELSMAYDDTLEGWASALDLRDKETQGHTRRVTDMTIELARALDIRDINLLHVRWGALLHDIGKMGIPDEVLRKPATLTDEEWKVMRQHPQYAYDMLAHISYLRPALDIPYCHHEKWDGTGYPRGLAGEQIPIMARIFSIVDVWDALLSDRAYRKAWPYEKVVDYIRSQSGRQFDPAIVRIFLETIADKWRP